MIVTSTGIVFSTARDGVFYAFDAENGEVLWSHKLPMATEGLPAIYEVKGRHYIVVNATTPHTWGLNSRESGIGSPEPLGKGGYVVFGFAGKPSPLMPHQCRAPGSSVFFITSRPAFIMSPTCPASSLGSRSAVQTKCVPPLISGSTHAAAL